MKNTLLTTTAIAVTGFAGTANAVEVAAGAVNLDISGYFDTVVVGVNNGGTSVAGQDFDGLQIHTTSEVHFKPSVTLDNGITIGADIELEGDTSGDQIDESTIFAKGDFGTIEIGAKDSAAKRLGIIAPDASMVYANSSSLSAFIPYGGLLGGGFTAFSTYADLASDAERITYITPNFNGFQAGISYSRNGNDNASGTVDANTASTTDFIDLGASYNGSVGGVDLGISLRHSMADRAATAAALAIPSTGPGDLGTAAVAAVAAGDITSTGAGLSVGFGGFTIGGSYIEIDTDTVGSTDGEAYDIGVSYANGPMTYSLTYFNGESVGTVGAAGPASELSIVVLAARYNVGDNFAVSASLQDITVDQVGVETFDSQSLALGASFWF